MTRSIRKVAVIGAGTMGGAIAAHVANAGLPVTLLDVAPTELTPEEQARGLALESRQVRNRVVAAGLERVKNSRPPALFVPERAQLITIGNLEDDLGLLADADWIVEAIVEQLEPKQALMERIEQVRKPGCIVSTNTSGIPIAAIGAGRSEAFRRHFLGTHFFNPPRYMYLLELIPTPDTLPEVLAAIGEFADVRLGKGVVIAKDRPNFIANRIGTYSGLLRLHYALEHGYSVEEVDALTGELIGNPKTATFRLYDLVGLDVMAHVARNLDTAAPDDEERAIYRVPPAIEQMIERGWLGNKAGAGFYKETRGASGREFWPLNLQTLTHEPPTKPRFDLVGRARRIDDLRERLRLIAQNAGADRAGMFLRDTTLRILAYAACRLPEIADTPAEVDRAMRWGFNQALGPFETWDALGARGTAATMREQGIGLAPWVEQMLEAGIESFYQREGERVVGVYDPSRATYVPLEQPAGTIALGDLRAQGRELARNESASILDLGDGVLCLEFHSKLNTLDPLIFAMGRQALAMLEDGPWAGLVIGNQGPDFCVGANLALVGMTLAGGQFDQLREIVRETQSLFQAFRMCLRPVVAAPHGRVLGGGAEVAMAAARRVAAAETYIGQVELGVGLVPAAGGCKEFLRRVVSPAMRVAGADALPHLRAAFETIALAQVSESAEGARRMGFLEPEDRIVMNRARLISEAKRTVLELVASGYTPPGGEPIYAIGRRGLAALATALHGMRLGGYISAYDEQLGRALAWILCGGDLSAPQWVTEQYILDLEAEQFIKLCREPKTQERIMAMLQSGKPLRN